MITQKVWACRAIACSVKSTFATTIVVLLSLTQPALAGFVTVINIPDDPDIPDNQSIGSNTQLNLFDGGRVGDFFEAGAPAGLASNIEVNVFGGSVGVGLDAYLGTTVNISGGSVGSSLNAYSGSEVNVSGGTLGRTVQAFGGSTVNLSGGSIGQAFVANSGSLVNISGGSLGPDSRVFSDGTVNISGGTVGRNFNAFSGSEVNITGGDIGVGFLAFPDSLVEPLNIPHLTPLADTNAPA